MSRGKAVQEGVRVKLPADMTWEKLASLQPEEVKERQLWPAGFLPLAHPHHEAGGMVFPKFLIEETKKQSDRDLTRFMKVGLGVPKRAHTRSRWSHLISRPSPRTRAFYSLLP
jgi:cytochrome c peroxidase